MKEIFTEAPLPSAPNASCDVSEKPEANNVTPYTLHVCLQILNVTLSMPILISTILMGQYLTGIN